VNGQGATFDAPARQRVWDVPLRMVHWTIVILIATSWWTAEQGMLDWHRLSGYLILALLLFRLLWGVLGSTTARFASFVRGPAAVISYVRRSVFTRTPNVVTGHNPIGGWSAVVMLSALLTQAILGLFAVDIDGLESGPLASHVSFDAGRLAAETHAMLFNILLALIALHVAAVLFYLIVKRTNLLLPMILGWRRGEAAAAELYFAPLGRAAILLAICGATVWAMVKFAG